MRYFYFCLVQVRSELISHQKQSVQELLNSDALSISPEWMLSQLPEGQLIEERALILRRLGKHREAGALLKKWCPPSKLWEYVITISLALCLFQLRSPHPLEEPNIREME